MRKQCLVIIDQLIEFGFERRIVERVADVPYLQVPHPRSIINQTRFHFLFRFITYLIAAQVLQGVHRCRDLGSPGIEILLHVVDTSGRVRGHINPSKYFRGKRIYRHQNGVHFIVFLARGCSRHHDRKNEHCNLLPEHACRGLQSVR